MTLGQSWWVVERVSLCFLLPGRRLFVSFETGSQPCSTGWAAALYVDQDGLRLKDLPDSSWVLVLKVCTTNPDREEVLKSVFVSFIKYSNSIAIRTSSAEVLACGYFTLPVSEAPQKSGCFQVLGRGYTKDTILSLTKMDKLLRTTPIGSGAKELSPAGES